MYCAIKAAMNSSGWREAIRGCRCGREPHLTPAALIAEFGGRAQRSRCAAAWLKSLA
jgi:hypothetical protein